MPYKIKTNTKYSNLEDTTSLPQVGPFGETVRHYSCLWYCCGCRRSRGSTTRSILAVTTLSAWRRRVGSFSSECVLGFFPLPHGVPGPVLYMAAPQLLLTHCPPTSLSWERREKLIDGRTRLSISSPPSFCPSSSTNINIKCIGFSQTTEKYKNNYF